VVAHLFGIAFSIFAPAAMVAAALWFLWDDDALLILRIAGFAVCTTLAFVYLKSLLPHRRQLPAAMIPIRSEDQATIYTFVDRVAMDLGVTSSIRIFVGSGTELKLGGRRSLLDLIRRPRWELHIGIWLWHAVTLSELQALIARTLAPIAGGRGQRFRTTVRSLLDVMANGVDRLDEVAIESDATLARLARIVRAAHAVSVFPMRLLARLLLRIDPVRDSSIADDLDAVRVAGSDALVHGILRSDIAAAALREWDDKLDDAARAGVLTIDLYAHVADGLSALREAHNDLTLGETPTLRGPTAGKYADVFEPGSDYVSRMWSGFPRPDEREQFAKRDFVAAERDDRPATVLLDEPGPLRHRMTRLHYVEFLRTVRDYIPLAPETVRRWIGTKPDTLLPEKFAGCYDPARKIDPGTDAERAAALAAQAGNNAELLASASGLYARAAERASTWRTARMALDKLNQRTVYHPVGRTRAMADDLEDDMRKAGRWLAALDRWAYVIHMHMAARLPDLHWHETLWMRYESVLRFQSIAVDAREYRNRVAAFVRRLDDPSGMPSYHLRRDAALEFGASRRDLGALLSEAAVIQDQLLREWTGDLPLDDFLFAHEMRPPSRARGTVRYGRKLLNAWNEISAKARWLHQLGIAALLELHDEIEREFAARVPPGELLPVADVLPEEPPPLPSIEPDASDEIGVELDEAEIVAEAAEGAASDDQLSNPWGEGR
jgi:hypothetical protein